MTNPYLCSVTIEGDETLGASWLNFARGHLRTMLMLGAANKFQTFYPVDGVEVRIWTNPNRIYIKAETGKIAIAYPDVTQAVGARTLLSTDSKLNVPPTGTPPFGYANFPIGSDYWVDSKGREAISWTANNLYYRGVQITTPFPSYYPIVSAAIQTSSASGFTAWVCLNTYNASNSIYVYYVTVDKGVVQNYVQVNVDTPSDVVGAAISDDLTFIAYWGAAIHGSTDPVTTTNVYRLDISPSSTSPKYALGPGPYTPVRVATSSIPLYGAYPYTDSVSYTYNSSNTGTFESLVNKTGSEASSGGPLIVSDSTGGNFNFRIPPKIKNGILYGVVCSSPTAFGYNSSLDASFNMQWTSKYIYQFWLIDSGTSTASSTSSTTKNVTTPMRVLALNPKTGGIVMTDIAPIYDLSYSHSNTTTRQDVYSQTGGANSGSITSDTTVSTTEITRVVKFADGFYNIIIVSEQISTESGSGSAGTQQSETSLILYVGNTRVSIASADPSSTAVAYSGSWMYEAGVWGPPPDDSYSSGTATIPLYTGSNLPLKPYSSAEIDKYLVVCVRDSLPTSSGGTLSVKATLVFSLNKATRAATLLNILNYDIREYPNGTIGRISTTKYPK